MKNRIIFITGPTAIGKSKTAVLLAKKLGAEIISCDSMQVYKGMDILTSKPSAKLRKAVKHHLIDSVPRGKGYDVCQYRKDAVGKIEEIIRRGKLPLIVGGTGLYISVLIDGIFKEKAKNKNLREKFYRQAGRFGSAYLYKKLKKLDPEAAQKIHPNDTKRIVRALEVFKATGKPISFLQKQRIGLAAKYDIAVFCLDMEREELYRKIDERVEDMFKKGIIREVKAALKSKLSRTASCAIGIKELKGYFDGGYDLEEAKRLIKKNTRNYSKRQLTWFRKDKRIKWLKIGLKEPPSMIANRIFNLL